MFKLIIEAAIRFRWSVLIIVTIITGYGLFELIRLPIDAVPDITNRQVKINTAAPALAPEQIERLVTYPLETALAGIPGLTDTRSLSRNGFSQITAIFTDQTDIYFARQRVAERIREVEASLPAEAIPLLSPVSTGLGEVLMWTVDYAPFNVSQTAIPGQPGWQPSGYYLTPEGEMLKTELERAAYLRTVQDWIISPQMRTTSGLAGVDTIGGYIKEYAVRPDLTQLAAYGLSLTDLSLALERANVLKGAGIIQRAGEGVVVRADAQALTIADLAKSPLVDRDGLIVRLGRDGLIVRVGDVASVESGQEPRQGAASRDGREIVQGTALMLMGGNSRTVAQEAAKRLNQIAGSLPTDIIVEPVLDRSQLVNATISTVAKNLTEGALLVIAVLFILLGNIRAALITALVIPLSFLFAIIGMSHFGISGNLMSLGALDFGILVDGSVIVIETTLLKLGQRYRALKRPLSPAERLRIAAQAAKSMLRPAAFGQLIILLVFVPVLTLEGIEGKTFQPMAATFMLALLGAFIFSFTVVPTLAALLVREPKSMQTEKTKNASNNDHGHETYIISIVRRWVEPIIRQAITHPWIALCSGGAALFIGIAAFLSLGREFMPPLEEGNIAMQVMRVPSTSIEQSLAMQMALEKAITTLPEVKTVFSRTGTAEAAMDPMPPNITDSIIILKARNEWPDPLLDKQALVARIQSAGEQHIGNAFEFSQPIQLRFNELIAGVRTDLAVMIFGEDFSVLQSVADQITNTLQRIPGASDLSIEQVSGQPTLTATIDHTAAALYGLSAADISDALSIGIGGLAAGQIFEGDRRFNVVVRLDDSVRNDLAQLTALPIISPRGEIIPLSAVARINITEGPNQISRDNGNRRMVVQANVRDRDLGRFVKEAQRAMEDIVLPPGVYLKWGGQFENLQRAQQRLLTVIPTVFVLIGVLLFMALRNVKEAMLVFACVPLALVGSSVALLLREMPFSISAAVGFITVSGVATLNGLVLMQAIREQLNAGCSVPKAALNGAINRLRPVFTTALVAIVGFIPMALASGVGSEVQKPLATVVIGGLLTATMLTLLLLPALVAVILSTGTSRRNKR